MKKLMHNTIVSIRKIKTVIVALAFSMLSLTIYAQQEALQEEGTVVKLSLEKSRQMAIENNIENNIAKEQIKIADNKVAAYKTNYLPKISATGLYLFNDVALDQTIEGGQLPTFLPDGMGGAIPDGGFAFMPEIPLEFAFSNTYNAAVKIEQPIYTGGKINAGNKMAEKGREMAQANVALSEIEVMVLSDEAYWNVVKVKALIESAVQYKETLEELHRMVQNAVNVGM